MSRAYRKILQQRELQNMDPQTSEEEEEPEEKILSKPNLFGMVDHLGDAEWVVNDGRR
jgi:hypothetical protein